MRLHSPIAWLAVVLLLCMACDNAGVSDSPSDEPDTPTATVRFVLPSSPTTIGAKIHNGVMCGSTQVGRVSTDGTNSVVSFDILGYEGKNTYFFVTNLTPADQTQVQSATLEAFNTLQLNTADYISTSTNPADPEVSVPMVAMLVDQTWKNLSGFGKQAALMRLFAVVDYEINFSEAGFGLVSVAVKNVPQKFAIASAINNYDLTTYGYMSLDLGSAQQGAFFLPENKVSDPVFYDADDNGMTYLEITYTDPDTGSSIVHVAKYRIAEYGLASGYVNYGNVLRNNIFKASITIDKTTKGNSIEFLN